MDSSPWVERWSVWRSVEAAPSTDGWVRFSSDLPALGFTVRTGNVYSSTPEDYEVEFGAGEEDAAKELADEFNRYEFQGPIPPAAEARRGRLKSLCPDFGSFYFEGPRAARWPVDPGRYLVRDGGVGWHAEAFDELAEDLEAVKVMIAGDESNVYEVIDLDTGDAVPFERTVAVALGVG